MRCKLIARNSSLISKPLKLSINKFFLYYNMQHICVICVG